MTSVVMIICWWDLFHMTWLPSGTCACLLDSQNARCREISFDGTMKNSVCMAWCTLAKWKVNEELPAVINPWYHFGGLQLIIHDLGVLSDSCWLTRSIMQDLILSIILVACDIISYGVLTWSLFIHSCWNGFTTPIPYSLNSHLELMEVIMSFLPGFVPTWSEPGGALSWSEVVCASPNVQSISRISSWTTSVHTTDVGSELRIVIPLICWWHTVINNRFKTWGSSAAVAYLSNILLNVHTALIDMSKCACF